MELRNCDEIACPSKELSTTTPSPSSNQNQQPVANNSATIVPQSPSLSPNDINAAQWSGLLFLE
jgi:hypothetical protein